MDPQQQVKLERKLEALKRREQRLRQHRDTAEREIVELEAEQKKLEKRLAAVQGPVGKVRVTDHAVLKYLERVEGVDVERARRSLVDEETATRIKQLRSGTFPRDGYRLKVRDGTVVTVLPPKKERSS